VPKQPRVVARLIGISAGAENIDAAITVPLNVFLIGRKNAEVHLDLAEIAESRTVSHKHCGVSLNKYTRKFQLENFGRNGTRLNGTPFGKVGDATRPLNDGDFIEVGKVKFQFQIMKPLRNSDFITMDMEKDKPESGGNHSTNNNNAIKT